jgi:acyl dehydratase
MGVGHPGLWFEEFELGDVHRHVVTRTVTESDNVMFTCLTMNPQPLHLDARYAAESEFGQPIVNSLYTLALLVGLTVADLTLRTTIANLGFESVAFPKPVFHGDTIRAETHVIAARASASRPSAGIVTLEHVAVKQTDDIVAVARRSALVRRRPS